MGEGKSGKVSQLLSERAATSHEREFGYYGLLTQLAKAVKAKRALELGTFRGGSAQALLDGLPKDGVLVSVDLAKSPLPASLESDSRFRQVIGDTTWEGTCAQLGTGFDLVFVDTAHEYETVSREWQLVEPLLKPGAVVCFDDIHLNEGMARFWNELPLVKWDTGDSAHFSGFGVALNEPEPQFLERPKQSKLAVCVLAHDDCEWLAPAVRSTSAFGDVFVFVNGRPWSGEPRDTSETKSVAASLGAQVAEGNWLNEDDHRQKAHLHLRSLGYTHALVADSDEVFEERLIKALKDIALASLADRVHVEWDTYWCTPEHVVRPREPFTPCVLVDLFKAFPVHLRNFGGGRPLMLDSSHGIVHHLSYAGSDERIRRKVTGWSHKDDVVPGWWQDKWEGWKRDPSVRDLHPTHPANYAFVERVRLPEPLAVVGIEGSEHGRKDVPSKWPRVSVCVPLYGGAEDIARCLDSLERCKPLVHEAVVVDNGFPDGAKDEVKKRPWAKLIENTENAGFAKASNQAYEASEGEIVLFLNSDTVVTWHGLKALVEDLASSGTVGAVGPVSNAVGHSQQIGVTYTNIENAPLFAEDLYTSGRPSRETDMLVGFCMAVKRSVLEELGGFDESFGTGLFEDNDLCYRMRRAGYRLLVCERAFVHHKGSASLVRSGLDASSLLAENGARFKAKWARDLETGFASHLSGLSPDPIVFDPGRKPETLFASLADRAQKASVSLCMIVKDEERVIGECLKSAMPFFKETIVVDTGSTDRTVQIAESLGARVYHHPWQESFSEARNNSLSYAGGKWLFWMDADDTLPLATGEAIVGAALSAPPEVHGFVVPVQFVEEGPGSGTRVDHVKLLRNLPGLRFEGRIHEQVLGSLRAHGGTLGHLGQVVLHSGYDTSEAGQAKKRTRDRHLLKLDYFERPGHPFVLFNLGMTCHYLGEHKKAARWLRKSVALAQDGESHLRKAYDLWGVSLRELGRADEALAVFREGVEKVGGDAEIHFHTGLLLSMEGDLEGALEQYDKVLSYDPAGHFHSFDIGILGFKTVHNRAGVLARMGRYEEARDGFLASLKENPRFLPSAFELFQLALERRDFGATRLCVNAVFEQEGFSRDAVDLVVRETAEARGREAVPALLSDLAARHPQFPELRLRLGRELAESGRVAEAAPLLEGLKAEGFAEAAFVLGVAALLRDDYPAAKRQTQEAHRLNPGHAQTIEQLRAVNRSLGLPEEDGVVQ